MMPAQPADLTDLGFTIDGRPITLQDVAARLPTCTLCGGVPIFIGCFIPHAHRAQAFLHKNEPIIGPVRPGKQRVGFYALCQACGADPATAARVEAHFLGPEPDA